MSQLALNEDPMLEAARGPAEVLRLITADFDRLYRSIHHYLLHRFFDVELAEELTAQTFYRLAISLPVLRGDARRLEAWLFRTATNLANTHLRRQRIRRIFLGRWARQQPVSIPPADPASEEDAQTAGARAALLALPSRHQTAIVLRYYSGLSFEDIATVLKCRPDAGRQRVSRGLAKLRNQLNIQRGG